MLYNDVVTAALELCGEPTALIGSGRWSVNELKRAVNNSVGYIYDVMDEQTEIQVINTVAGSNMYDLSNNLRATSRIYLDGAHLIKVAPSTLPITDVEGTPSQCSVFAADSSIGGYTLAVWPTPSEVHEMEVVYTGFAALSTGDTIYLPNSYEEVIIFGAAAHMCKKLVVNKNNNADIFELERNKMLSQLVASNNNSDNAGLWSHG